MEKPKLLDLFSGAGGTSMGYYRAGFAVYGIDNKPQPHYPFPFLLMDALEAMERLLRGEGLTFSNGETLYLADFVAYHASPPCQAFSSMTTKWNSGTYIDCLTPTLKRFQGLPLWIVENVVGAPMPAHVQLCGSVFDLGSNGYQLRRHRWFQSNILIPTPPCNHKGRAISVIGGVKINRLTKRVPFKWGQEAMGID